MSEAITSTSFYSNEQVVLHRKVGPSDSEGTHIGCRPTNQSLVSYYDIEASVQFITSGKYSKVALQFPDHLLPDASAVYDELMKRLTPEAAVSLFILADTTYGQCCVDEVAAEHVEAQAIIHYGPACLSPTRRIPVYYVFGKHEIDTDDFIAKLDETFPSKDQPILIFYDVIFEHMCHTIAEQLKATGRDNTVMSYLTCRSTIHSDDEQYVVEEYCGRQYQRLKAKNLEDYSVVYIGEEGRTLSNLALSFNKNSLYSYSPTSRSMRLETAGTNKSLMKRYYLIEKAKDADIIGILVGTLSVARYLDVIERLKQIIEEAGKMYYIFAVGKINVPKLANFAEVDMFVLVACPENSMIDSKEFYKPIVTPFELEIALVRGREWTGEYTLDFSRVLTSETLAPHETDEEETHVSLISKSVKTNPKHYATTKDLDTTSGSLIVKEEMSLISTERHSATSVFLQRTFQGLQQMLGQSEPMMAIEGRSGIPMEYEGEGVDTGV